MTKRIFIFLLVVGLSLCLFPLASAFGYGYAEKTYDVDVYVGYFGTTYVKIANVTEDEMREMECGEWTYSSIDRGGYTRYNLAYGVTLESLLSNLNIATSDVDEIYFLGTDDDYWAGFYNMFGRPHYYFPYLAENYNQENPDASNIAVITSKYEEVPAILAFQQSLYRDTEAFDYDKYKSMMDDDECLRIVFGQTEWNEVSTFDSVKWVYEIAVSLKGSPITTSNWDAEIGSSQALEGYYQVNSGFSELDEKIKSGVKVTSDNPSVVQVDANNNLIAVGKGTARINIEYTDDEYGNTGAFSEQIVVTVTGDADPVPENPGSGDTDDPVPDDPNDDPNYDPDPEPDPEPDAEPESEDEPNPVPGDPDKETPTTDGQDDEDDPDLVPDEEDEPTPDDEEDQELDEEDETEPDEEDEPETDDDNDSRGDGDAAGFEGDEDDGSNGSSEGDGSGDSTLTQGTDLEPSLEDSSAPSTGSFNKEGGTEAGEESGSGNQASDGAGDADRISSGMANGEELVPLSGEGEAVYNEVKGYMADQLGEMENVPSTEQITDITEDVRRYIEELVEQMEEEDVPVDFDEIVEMVEEYIDELVEETESEEISEDNTADDSEAAKAVYLSLGNVTGGDSTGGNVAGGSMSTGNTAGGSGGKVLEIESQPFYYTVILIAAAAALFVGGGLYRILRFRREIAER